MKRILQFVVCFLFSINTFSQTISFTEVNSTSVPGGINVIVKAISLNGAGYLNHSYNIVGNTINLDVCYWFNMTLPVLFFENEFFIPIPNQGNYTLNVFARNSISSVVCDNFSTSDTEIITVNYLANEEFERNNTKVYPNPFSNNLTIESEDVIANYDMFDATGKQLINSNNKNVLENTISQLQQGIYFLNLQFENGKKHNYKLVKK